MHQLHYNMKFVILGIGVEFPHEILILYYSWMYQVLGYIELIIHIFHRYISKLGIVIDLPYLIYELPRNAPDLDLEDIALST